jgi:hypothetical protein
LIEVYRARVADPGIGLWIEVQITCTTVVNLVGNSGCKVAIWSKLYSRVVQYGRVCDWNV